MNHSQTLPERRFSALKQRDAHIDANHVRVDPAIRRVERVGKPVPSVDPIAEPAAHLAHGGHRDVGSQHQRARGGGGYDRAVDARITRRPTPGDVAFPAVRGRDAPDVLRVPGKLLRQAQTEGLVRAGGRNRVLPPIRIRRLAFMPAAEIHPGVSVLMHEEGRRSADIRVGLERDNRTPPGTATTRRQSRASAIRSPAGTGSSARSSDPSAPSGSRVSGFHPCDSRSGSPASIQLKSTRR